ncbi:HAD-IA family hydrolase [Kitasatospora purpeofusca]|uniref:HAD-IA family hydrolase n=1 Tax=Kitasatospora purpeofusca TaxID=67352 RepID=UPI0035DD1415
MNAPAAAPSDRGVLGILTDLDGVVRHWRRQGASAAEAELGLPPRTLSRYTSSSHSDAAHAGALTWEQWTDGVRERIAADHGTPIAERAVELWSADRGEVNEQMAGLLRRARATGLIVAVLTNNTTVLDADLALHGLDDLFDHVFNSAATGLAKPSPRAYEHALATMGLKPHQVVFTDDSALNADAARSLGMHAHHFREPDGARAFEDYLAALGVTLAAHADDPAPARPLRAAGPPPGHAEHDDHHSLRTRYTATGPDPKAVAARLTATGDAAWALPTGRHTLLAGDPEGRVTRWRLLPPGTDPAHAAGNPEAWMPAPVPPGAEYLPPWTPGTRTEAAAHAAALITEAAAALTRAADTQTGSDPLTAALDLDTARHHLTRLAAMLARRQPRPWPDAPAARYLDAAATTLLTASLQADPTTSAGRARSATALFHLLSSVRRTAALLLDAYSPWPWPDLERRLVPLLATTLAAPDTDALYGVELAATYDEHRPVAPGLAEALRAFAAGTLAGRDVLELGAGTGRITAHLAHTAATYTALETSPAMARRLMARNLPGVRLFVGDALAPPLPDDSTDVVVEHEVLLFTADPLAAADQALRVLRPGGTLVRLLLHAHGEDPAADLDTVYRAAAFHGRPAPLITGKGTDRLVTAHLATCGLPTAESVLAEYTEHTTPARALAALDARAWPYQHQATPAQHTDGMTAAELLARALPEQGQPVRYRLRALTTTKEAR